MTPLLEGVGIALDSLRSNKVRAALTILGVAIGVMVVMVIGALIAGFDKGLSDELATLGPKTFYVGRFYSGGIEICDDTDEHCPWRHNPPMSMADARVIKALPSVQFVALDEGTGGVEVSYGDRRTSSVSVHGRSADWVNVGGGDVFPGRSYTPAEDEAGAQVVVINQKLSEWMFSGLNPLDRTIKIGTMPYQVIGVFNPPPQLFGGDDGFEVFIPHGALVKYINYWKGWMDLLVGPTANASTQQAMEDVTEALRIARGLRPGQPNNFAVVSQEQYLADIGKMTAMMRILMVVLSMAGLMVGGVGVVAIMMISVTERTREIGVRKALGATRHEILWQFLVEAATLTLAGGVCGMIAGGLISFLLKVGLHFPAHVPVGSVVVALLMAAFTGVLFGIYPASRAARLDPVEALRYE
ncbi:MAG TPA: ABC transporter permease [Gemmatimonadales bacterium]|nr:ABC transporter permease [Gemmatimonadales bacterium]